MIAIFVENLIVMKQFLPYFVSSIVSVLLGYLINQLDPIPNQLKPWAIFAVVGLTFLAAYVLATQGTTSSGAVTGIRRVTIKGNKNDVQAGERPIQDSKIDGDENHLNSNGQSSGGGQQP